MIRSALIPLAAAGLLLSAEAAFAHAKLVSSTPQAGATIAAPSRLILHFSEGLAAGRSSAEVFKVRRADGATVSPPSPVSMAIRLAGDRTTLVASMASPLPAGAYLLSWHAKTADDNERTNGVVPFTVR